MSYQISQIEIKGTYVQELFCRYTANLKEEITYNAHEHLDAVIISENIENKLITLNTMHFPSKNGEDAIFSIFQHGGYDAIYSDDKRFIKRLRFLNIPYITPSVFIALLLKKERLTTKEAQEKLDCLSSFVSDKEYNVIKAILENWGR